MKRKEAYGRAEPLMKKLHEDEKMQYKDIRMVASVLWRSANKKLKEKH